jgi:chromosome segregation ATPase
MDQYAIYQQAAKNLKTNPSSLTDKFIVDLWGAAKALNSQVVNLKQELADTQKRAAEHFSKIDRLESQVARLSGQAPIFVMPKPATAAE